MVKGKVEGSGRARQDVLEAEIKRFNSSLLKSQQISNFLTTDFQLSHSLDSSDPSKDVIDKDKSQSD